MFNSQGLAMNENKVSLKLCAFFLKRSHRSFSEKVTCMYKVTVLQCQKHWSGLL